MSIGSFSERLPFWASRSLGRAGLVILTDGSLVMGFSAEAPDIFGLDDGEISRRAMCLERALSALPDGTFLRVDYTSGLSHGALIERFERSFRGSGRLLAHQRRLRAEQLKADASLSKGRIVYWLGLIAPFGLVTEKGPSKVGRLLAPFQKRRHLARTALDPESFEEASAHLFALGASFTETVRPSGLSLTALSEAEVLAELHEVLNPVTKALVGPLVPERERHGLGPDALSRSDLLSRKLTLREQLPLADLTATSEAFSIDEPALTGSVLSLQRLPPFTTPVFLQAVQHHTAAPFRLSTLLLATDKERLIDTITLRRNRLASQSAGHVRNVGADLARAEHEELLERLIGKDQSLFRCQLTATAYAKGQAELTALLRTLKEAFGKKGAALTIEAERQAPAFIGQLPASHLGRAKEHTVPSDVAKDLLFWSLPAEGVGQPDFLYHTRLRSLRKVSFLSGSQSQNKNALVFGGSGSGKSFNVTTLLEQAGLAQGAEVTILDVQGPEVSSYRPVAELLGGSYTALSGARDISFNPLFEHGQLFSEKGSALLLDEEKVSFLVKLLWLICLPDAPSEDLRLAEPILRGALLRAYKATRKTGRAPLLRDVASELGVDKDQGGLEPRLKASLQAFLSDRRRAELLDRPSRHERAGGLTVIDFHGLEKDEALAGVILLSVSFSIWARLKEKRGQKGGFVVFDECWKLLSHPVASQIVAELFRTGRKWGASCWAITQDLQDLTSAPCAPALLANSQFLFLNKHAGGHDAVASFCGLTRRQTDLFKSLEFKKGEYAELLLVDRGAAEATVARLCPTGFDYWLNTSAPEDRAFREALQSEQGLSLEEAILHLAKTYPHGAPRTKEAA